MHKRGFTLIELLVVIAIIAILSVVVILTLNPSELLRQSRDSNRVADLANINESLGIYAEDVGGSFGNASTTYISIPDPSATSTAGDQCQGLGLPTLVPTSTVYHCAASSTYRNPNGTGWIPVNFSSISIGSPLSVLPVDPVNTTSSGDYYAYIPGQSSANTFELIARMESQKYTASSGAGANDGGYSSQYDEVGKDLTLALNMPQNLNRVSSTDYLSFDQNGLVGYWPLNEGNGTTAYDQSGNGNNGTWSGTQAGSSGYYSPGVVGNWAGYFNDGNDKISLGSSVIPHESAAWQNFTVGAWINTNGPAAQQSILEDYTVSSGSSGSEGNFVFRINSATSTLSAFVWSADGTTAKIFTTTSTVPTGSWTYVAAVFQNYGATISIYINGLSAGTGSSLTSFGYAGTVNTIIGNLTTNYSFNGLIDDVRLYSRALSSQEIAALYNGGM